MGRDISRMGATITRSFSIRLLSMRVTETPAALEDLAQERTFSTESALLHELFIRSVYGIFLNTAFTNTVFH